MLCDSVGIESHLNHLPIPISFKGLYSNDDESAGVDDGEKKEEILENIDQIIEQVPILFSILFLGYPFRKIIFYYELHRAPNIMEGVKLAGILL